MQIDPKTSAYIMGGLAALGAIAGIGADHFPSYVPPGVALGIVQTASFVLTIVGSVSAALHLYSSSLPGPLVPAKSAAVVSLVDVTKASAVILALVLGSCLFGAPRAEAAGFTLQTLFAQIKGVGAKVQTPDQIASAILANVAGAGAPDLAAAIDAAKKSNNTVTMPCWTAIQAFNANIAALPQASTLPKVHIALDIEVLTELVIALQPNSPVITGCSALANFQKVAATNMVAGIVTGATSLAALAPIIP